MSPDVESRASNISHVPVAFLLLEEIELTTEADCLSTRTYQEDRTVVSYPSITLPLILSTISPFHVLNTPYLISRDTLREYCGPQVHSEFQMILQIF